MLYWHDDGIKKVRRGIHLHRFEPLNSNLLREVYPLPAIDETLAQLTGGAVFSELDTNSWQLHQDT